MVRDECPLRSWDDAIEACYCSYTFSINGREPERWSPDIEFQYHTALTSGDNHNENRGTSRW